jgi:hypothetical protein
MSIKANPKINAQAIFVAVDTRSKLKLFMTMHYKALNPWLKDVCVRAGLLQRNTTYSVQRYTC